MNIKNAIKNFISIGAVYYTLISVIIIIIAGSMTQDSAINLIATDKFLNILLFSYIMSFGSTIVRIPEVSKSVSLCVHACCYVIGFYIFVFMSSSNFAGSIIATAIFAVVYAIVNLVISIIKKKFCKNTQSVPNAKAPAAKAPKQKEKKETTYTSQFSK